MRPWTTVKVALSTCVLAASVFAADPIPPKETRPQIAGVVTCQAEQEQLQATTTPRLCCQGSFTDAGSQEVFVSMIGEAQCKTDAQKTRYPVMGESLALKPDAKGFVPFTVCGDLPQQAVCAADAVGPTWGFVPMAYVYPESPQGQLVYDLPIVGVVLQ